MKAKEIIPASKPRNFVAKNQKTAGAGAHKDKKKAAKQGDVKHKAKEIAETSQAYRDAMAKSREAEINYRADRAEKKLAKKAAEPKTLGQKIAKDIGGPLKKLAKGNVKGALGMDEGITTEGPLWKSDPYTRDYRSSVSGMGRRERDWDEGNTEPPNNFAIYINGKKWKVFKGRGQYADDFKERQHLSQLKDMCAKKSASTGKKWEVYTTGEAPTE